MSMPARTAATAAHDALERQAAARALLATPLMNAHQHPDELALVRRHAPALRTVFSRMLGYTLIVESSFARLVKAPLSPDAPSRAVRHGEGPAFGPHTYSLFCLACAALLAPGTGEQVLVSSFIEQIRADAAAAGVEVDDSLVQRRRLVAAVGLLIDWGVLTETDGTLAGWSDRKEEALLSIHRPLLAHLLARPLGGVTRAEDVPEQMRPEHDEPRRSLRRKLVENPLVRRDHLSDAERDVLSRERTELTRLLDEHFGLVLEVRAEGALAYSSDSAASDVDFPGPGTVRQAALLLVDMLLGQAPAAWREQSAGLVPELWCSWPTVDAALKDLSSRYISAWSSLYVRDVERLRDDVTALLVSLSLASADATGLRLHPAAARYRPLVRVPSRTRAADRLTEPTAADTAPAALFEDTWTTAREASS
ncbi:TIGR02678 family protein [Streptomyces sp. KS_5]|uniref:TIGR02678 family protein n=1 Tax=Streptomyces sp. KS_5 TaxID=1881018 RepID=UPI00089AB76D|nr:TIGR02678 family protein [Streptomyces sp. KS_5]SEE36747.1 TIGR02678 family protein [Streptomyces sp. KS_5]